MCNIHRTLYVTSPTGPSGIYPCSSGLKIMYLSGRESEDNKKSDFSFVGDDIKSLETECGNKQVIDILITGQWPKAVCNFAKKPVSKNRISFL